MVTLGVIADTHVPDRRAEVDPRALEIFRRNEVGAILHAGDVSVRRVLERLEEIAPVHAIRGNRDWLYLNELPHRQMLTFAGVRLGMVHAHGNLVEYLLDKLDFLINGLDQERYKQRALNTFPEADIVVFGHLHIPINEWVGERLLFNPGSACCPDISRYAPAVGILQLGGPQDIHSEIIPLSDLK